MNFSNVKNVQAEETPNQPNYQSNFTPSLSRITSNSPQINKLITSDFFGNFFPVQSFYTYISGFFYDKVARVRRFFSSYALTLNLRPPILDYKQDTEEIRAIPFILFE